MKNGVFTQATAIGGFILFLASPAMAGDPTGVWLRATGTSKIQISRCGNAYCGKIVWLREPNDPATGKPKTDNMNPDTSRQNRPLLGTRVILNMVADGTDKWRGRVYKADEGKTYTGAMTLVGSNKLKLAGCVLGGLICKTSNMTRVN